MKALRDLVNRKTYSDEPHFSDELLLPALAAGHHVTMVTAFLPSYLVRLASDVASSPQIEPGKLTVVFCVPFKQDVVAGEARLLSGCLSRFAQSAHEVKGYIDDSIKIVLEGGLRFGALLSREDQLLTPSCIGLIESGETGSPDVVSFFDGVAGDKNSPISVRTSWGEDAGDLGQMLRVVSGALNRTFPSLLRRSHAEVMTLLEEIRKKGYPKLDFPEGRDLNQASEKPKASSVARVRKTKVPIAGDDLEDDEFSEELLDELYAEVDAYDIDRISKEVLLREMGVPEEDISTFLGEPLDFSLFDFSDAGRQHTPALSQDLFEIVGNGYATCWCGESFSREQGCPESYY